MLKTCHSREFWMLAAVALLVLGAGLGLRDPWPADEPRFALVARQMVESGNWLFPHRGTELYSDKPPMLMWLQAAAYTVIRDWRVAFLLPSLLAGLGTIWCVVDLGGRLWTRRVGVYAGWALLFALQFTYQVKKAQIDPLVTFWITLSLYGFLRHLLTGPDWRMWTLGWAAAGLGIITKGVGVIALLVLLPAAFAHWRGWTLGAGSRSTQRGALLVDRRAWCGPLAFLAAISVWLVPMLVAALGSNQPEYRAYLDDILFRQTAGRYTGSWSHPQPWWYFGEVMLTGWLPVVFALPWAIPAWRRRLRRRDARYLLPLGAWLLIVLFFSIATGKRDVYIMPALPMLCLALAPLLPGIVRRAAPRWIAVVFGALLAGAALIVGVGILSGAPAFARLVEARDFGDGGRGVAMLLTPIGGWGVAALLWHRVRKGVVGLLWVLGGTWVIFSLVGYPLLNGNSSGKALMDTVGARIGPDAELGLVGWKEQHLLMADRRVSDFGFKAARGDQLRRGVAWLRAAPDQRWLMVLDDALLPCVDRARSEEVDAAGRRTWWLVRADAVQGPCVGEARSAGETADE